MLLPCFYSDRAYLITFLSSLGVNLFHCPIQGVSWNVKKRVAIFILHSIALGIRQCTEGGIEIGTLGSRGAKAGVEERNDGSNYKKDSVLTLCIKKERAAGKPSFNQSTGY